MNIKLQNVANGVAELLFDRPGVNVFDAQMLADLEQCIAELESRDDLTGLVLRSAHPTVFIAGADLHTLSCEKDPAALKEMALTGQRLFRRLARLPMTKVAAIHGACLGGGYECTLACDYRLATPDKSTKIGLPETSLGILPAWGGCTFLPRVVGVPVALDVILAGRRLAAESARRKGLIDAVVPRERLMEHAVMWAAKPARKPRGRGVMDSRAVMMAIRAKAGRTLLAKTGGHYPAPERALELIARTLHLSVDASLNEEAEQFARLAVSEVSRNLVRLFFMQEAAKKKHIVDTPPDRAAQVAVIGAGVMGAGIAQWCAAKGLRVILKDLTPAAVAGGMKTVRKVTQKAVDKHIMNRAEGQAVLDRILPAHTEVPLQAVDVVIEAVVEKMSVKESLFQALGQATGPSALLASNTSALSVSDMAQAARDPGRVCGIHFFNPVHQMALVEVVQSRTTTPDALQKAVSFVQQLGKTPVVVQDRPGFVVNRVLMPYLIEAGRLFEEGVGVEALDNAMLSFGMPMGPMRLMDEIGIDVCLHVAEFLCSELPHLPAMPGILSRMVAQKQLGKKAGGGFYIYRSNRKPVARNVEGDAPSPPRAAEDLRDRMALPMVNEAARILDEKVAAAPEDVDLAMVLGTGFAPFTGGPLRYADARGVAVVADRMRAISKQGGDHLAPCVFLEAFAKQGGQFYAEGEVCDA